MTIELLQQVLKLEECWLRRRQGASN